ncbi:MAG TPA: outer membrane protein assembly factor BamD [Holophagaceae bacterium]|nr:outer membrane protein assembly factor BamD [Holophagaceae bacterium]
MKVRLSTVAISLALVLSPLACKKAKVNPKANGKTAAQLLQEGGDLLKRGRFDDARKMLRILEENLPSSPEFPDAKLMLGDSFFFQSTASYPEAIVEYQSFLNYFPKHERRDYAMYHLALCHYASIESADRDQAETKQAVEAFQRLLSDQPGSPYAVEAKDRIIQCWRRIAEHELVVGVYYVNSFNYTGAEKRLKALLETYPDYADRERVYFYLGEAMRQRFPTNPEMEAWQKAKVASFQKDTFRDLEDDQKRQTVEGAAAYAQSEIKRFRDEAKGYYQKLVESYPNSEWARRAGDRLREMGSTNLKEELDS